MRHHVVILSGGMDSVTLLHKVNKSCLNNIKKEDKLYALSFEYEQRHGKELRFSEKQAELLDIEFVRWYFCVPSERQSALTNYEINIPEGHYASESMKQTVVPGRNTLFLAYGLAYAQSLLIKPEDTSIIYYGAHAGDHPIYPDCRPAYVAAMTMMIEVASDMRVTLRAPFAKLDKGDIVKLGSALGVDYAQTWTCYNGGEIACGRCGSCCERLMAFDKAGAIDPLEYVDREAYKEFTR